MEKQLLITGHPRSGGTTLMHYFQSAGFALPHERVKADCIGTQSPMHAVPGWFRNGETHVEWAPVLHQTRDPLRIIASMCVGNAPFLQHFMVGHSSATYMMSLIERACRFIVEFKPIIEARNPVYRFKIEDIDEEWHNVLSAAELEDRPLPTGKGIRNYNKNPHTVDAVKYEDLRQYGDQIREIALEWGYDA